MKVCVPLEARIGTDEKLPTPYGAVRSYSVLGHSRGDMGVVVLNRDGVGKTKLYSILGRNIFRMHVVGDRPRLYRKETLKMLHSFLERPQRLRG